MNIQRASQKHTFEPGPGEASRFCWVCNNTATHSLHHPILLEEVVEELHSLIKQGREYPDAHTYLCHTYGIAHQVLQDAYDQSELEMLDD